MSVLYSFKHQKPAALPTDRIILSTGQSRTDPSTWTAEEILDAGYVVADSAPDYNSATHKLSWSTTGDSSGWLVTAIDSAELNRMEANAWSAIRMERNELLASTDVRVIRHLELSPGQMDSDLKVYRKSLRDLPQTYSASSDVVFPTPPWENDSSGG
tara:strand:- start:335 stop:805 length:471 start_codon:yes stop_codon:yes gene_type:complete